MLSEKVDENGKLTWVACKHMPVGFARAKEIYFDFRGFFAFLGLVSPSSWERDFSLPSFSLPFSDLPLLDFAGLVRGAGVEEAGALMFLSKCGRWVPRCSSNKGLERLEWNNGTCLSWTHHRYRKMFSQV